IQIQVSQHDLGGISIPQALPAILNLDGYLDAAVTVRAGASLRPHLEIWLNNGQGIFGDSGQRLSQSGRQAFALGDLNGDGAPDVYAACYEACYTLWINAGDGVFGP
ncbi:MAG: VCBS repeat-containing protein, partial [Anaerolineales bacterium]